MSVTHPSPFKVRALERRWEGQEWRLRRVARDLRAGRDWTVHLAELPFVEEIPPREGEALGRDLRGADLGRWLHPEVGVTVAREHEAPLVAAISLDALRNNTPLPDVSPFPVEVEGAGEAGLAWCLLRTTREVGLVPWYESMGYEVRLVRQLSYPDAPTCLDVVMAKRVRARGAARPPSHRSVVDGRSIPAAYGGPGF
jgi:hypothetical protein